MIKLKELRKQKGLSLKELGDSLGVAESTVSLYENGKREASYNILCKASSLFDVSIDYILGNSDEAEDDVKTIKLPILDSVSITSQGEIEYKFSDEQRAINLGNTEGYFFFKNHDDSMEPQISLGDIALIKKQNHAENGDLVAVICKDSPIMLRIINKSENATVLQAFNPKFKSSFITSEKDMIILGKVVQTVKKW